MLISDEDEHVQLMKLIIYDTYLEIADECGTESSSDQIVCDDGRCNLMKMSLLIL